MSRSFTIVCSFYLFFKKQYHSKYINKHNVGVVKNKLKIKLKEFSRFCDSHLPKRLTYFSVVKISLDKIHIY